MMDRKGGGPMKWNEFYGTTAEKFFYHPVDPNTTYHTNTALQQMGSSQDDKVGSGVPSSQSVPVHQRPPQFDYIYRANRDARDRAEKEAIAMAGKIEELCRRKFELEKEQAELWCLLAFRAIQRMNIPRKPLLRFQLVSASTDAGDMQRGEALSAVARFLAISLLIVDKAEEDQATAFGQIKEVVTNARNDFDDALLNLDAVAEDVSDRKTPLGKYVALAQLLDDTANNLSESHEVATEGDQAKDLSRKDRFRGLLQRSLVEYAQIVLALDELSGLMKIDWKVKVDTKNRVATAGVGWETPRVRPSTPASMPKPEATPKQEKISAPFLGKGKQLRGRDAGGKVPFPCVLAVTNRKGDTFSGVFTWNKEPSERNHVFQVTGSIIGNKVTGASADGNIRLEGNASDGMLTLAYDGPFLDTMVVFALD